MAAGSIVVNLIARTEAFTKGMSRSKKTIRSLERATMSTLNTVKRFGFIAGAAALGGLALLVKQSMKNVDVIAKLSDRIGVSTEFLAAFGHQAKISGLTTQEFNKGIEMFVRRIGELTQGTGEARYGLLALDLSLEQILHMNPEKSFLLIAERIRGLSTQAEKAAAAYRFFGRSGSKMLNLLEGDTKNVIARAKELGITFDREQARRIERANDAITRMQSAFEGVGNTLAVAVAPLIEKIADKISAMTSGTNSLEAMQKHVNNLAIGTTYVSDAFLAVQGVIKGIIGGVQGLISFLLTGVEVIMRVTSRVIEKLGKRDTAAFIRNSANTVADFAREFGLSAEKQLSIAGEKFSAIGKARRELMKMLAASPATIPDGGGAVPPTTGGLTPLRPTLASAQEIGRNISVSGLQRGGFMDRTQEKIASNTEEQVRILREVERNQRELGLQMGFF